jgi:hypothetical protein
MHRHGTATCHRWHASAKFACIPCLNKAQQARQRHADVSHIHMPVHQHAPQVVYWATASKTKRLRPQHGLRAQLLSLPRAGMHRILATEPAFQHKGWLSLSTGRVYCHQSAETLVFPTPLTLFGRYVASQGTRRIWKILITFRSPARTWDMGGTSQAYKRTPIMSRTGGKVANSLRAAVQVGAAVCLSLHLWQLQHSTNGECG